jgi:transposase
MPDLGREQPPDQRRQGALPNSRDIPIVAPLALNRPINGRNFRADIEQVLPPTLRPGDIVVADNLGSHRIAGVREAIEARGASWLRRADPRGRESLWQSIGNSLDRYTPQECKNYFINRGDGQTNRKRFKNVGVQYIVARAYESRMPEVSKGFRRLPKGIPSWLSSFTQSPMIPQPLTYLHRVLPDSPGRQSCLEASRRHSCNVR